jgi:hypothetical protein
MSKLIIMSLLLLSTVSCKYGVTYGILKDLGNKKAEVEKISSQDLTTANQKIIRAYFSSIKNLVYEFKNNSRIQSYTHKKFFNYYKNELCENGVLGEDVYSEIMKKCTVSGFYICTDEVKFYNQMLLEVRKLLTKREMAKILENESCKEKLLNLEVINE